MPDKQIRSIVKEQSVILSSIQEKERGLTTDTHRLIFADADANPYMIPLMTKVDGSGNIIERYSGIDYDEIGGNVLVGDKLRDKDSAETVHIGETGSYKLSTDFSAVSIFGALNELKDDVASTTGTWTVDGTGTKISPASSRQPVFDILKDNNTGNVALSNSGNRKLIEDFSNNSIIGALNELKNNELSDLSASDGLSLSEGVIGVDTSSDGYLNVASGSVNFKSTANTSKDLFSEVSFQDPLMYDDVTNEVSTELSQLTQRTPLNTDRVLIQDTSNGNYYTTIQSLLSGGIDPQDSVISLGDNTPPASPSEGDRYIIGDTPTGDWSSNAGDIAEYDGSEWSYTTPEEGTNLWVDDLNQMRYYTGSDWVYNPLTWDQVLQNGNIGYRPITVTSDSSTNSDNALSSFKNKTSRPVIYNYSEHDGDAASGFGSLGVKHIIERGRSSYDQGDEIISGREYWDLDDSDSSAKYLTELVKRQETSSGSQVGSWHIRGNHFGVGELSFLKATTNAFCVGSEAPDLPLNGSGDSGYFGLNKSFTMLQEAEPTTADHFLNGTYCEGADPLTLKYSSSDPASGFYFTGGVISLKYADEASHSEGDEIGEWNDIFTYSYGEGDLNIEVPLDMRGNNIDDIATAEINSINNGGSAVGFTDDLDMNNNNGIYGVGSLELDDGSNRSYTISIYDTQRCKFESVSQDGFFVFKPGTSDGTKYSLLQIMSYGDRDDTNQSYVNIGYHSTDSAYKIETIAAGSGSHYPITFEAGDNDKQILLKTNGDIQMDTLPTSPPSGTAGGTLKYDSENNLYRD